MIVVMKNGSPEAELARLIKEFCAGADSRKNYRETILLV